MMRNNMGNLMSQNGGNPIFIATQRQDTRKHKHLAAGGDKGILLRAVDNRDLPVEAVEAFSLSIRQQAPQHLVDLAHADIVVGQDAAGVLVAHLVDRRAAHGFFELRGYHVEAAPARHGHFFQVVHVHGAGAGADEANVAVEAWPRRPAVQEPREPARGAREALVLRAWAPPKGKLLVRPALGWSRERERERWACCAEHVQGRSYSIHGVGMAVGRIKALGEFGCDACHDI